MKKLILKRSLLFTVSITVFIKQVLIPNIIIYAEEDSINGKQPYSFTDHLAVNNQLFSYYIELIDANCNTVPQTNPIPQDMAITDYQNLYDNFYGLLLIDIDSSEFEIISNEETDYISSYILYDATTSVYSYVEVNHLNEENMLLCINSYVYMIKLKDDNLTILNEKGNKLDLITTFKENDGISEKLRLFSVKVLI